MSDPPSEDEFEHGPVWQRWSLGEASGFVELTDWTSFSVTGRDRKKFLNNFCTNDVNRLLPGQNCEAFFTNVKGKIIGHGLISCRDDELTVIGVPGQLPRLIDHLNRYVIVEDVQMRNTSSERAHLLLAGRDARDNVVALARNIVVGNEMLKPLVNAAGMAVDVPVHWIHWNLIGLEFSGILEVTAAALSRTKDILADREMFRCDMSAFNSRRIEGGTPLFGVDFDDTNFPQEVGRDQQAISFTKGCYLGQETVARIDALGHVNRRIVGIKFLFVEVPTVATELKRGDTVVGYVTSATYSPRVNAALALAMVRREHASVGTKLESVAGACEVIELPLPN
jgi:tRNA-modifying protein YgfZ